MTLYEESGDEPEPWRPGDSVTVFPVSVPGGPSGYIVFRPDDVQEEEPVTGFEMPTLDDDGPNRISIEILAADDDESAAVEDGEIIEAVWVLDDGTETTIGPVERALRADIGTLTVRGRLAGTLVASATALAQAMDRAAPDKISAVGRELREHIKRIEEEAGDDDDTTEHRSNLSTPV